MLLKIIRFIFRTDDIEWDKVPDHLRRYVKMMETEIRLSMREGMTFEEACEDNDIWLNEPYINPPVRDWRTSVIDEWDDWEFLKQFFSEHPVKEIKILSNTST